MDIKDSPLWSEVQTVINNGALPVHFSHAAVIHVISENTDYKAFKVVQVDQCDNYEEEYCRVTIIHLLVPAGVYAYHIYPNQANLQLTHIKTPIQESGNYADTDSSTPVATQYNAYIIDTGNPIVQQTGMQHLTEAAMDKMAPVKIAMQLVEKLVDQVRVLQFGTNFRNATPGDVVRAVLTSQCQTAKTATNGTVLGVSMIEANNKTARANITIPHGSRVVDVPMLMQNKQGGVYSAGLGFFYSNQYWYVYPCYDTTRFKTATTTMTVINIPEGTLPNIERTYRQAAGSLVVLATGQIKHTDAGRTNQIEHGNGVRFTDASNLEGSFVTVQDNKAYASRGDTTSEFISNTRTDGANYAPVSASPVQSNPYTEYSRLAKLAGGVITMEWQNSNPDLLTPGMMIRLLYMDDAQLIDIYGCLLCAEHYSLLQGQGVTSTRYTTQTSLAIFVQSRYSTPVTTSGTTATGTAAT